MLRGISASLPPLSAVALLDSSKNFKSHILALNLYITLQCVHACDFTSTGKLGGIFEASN